MIKNFVKKYFESFVYFYSHLRHRIFIILLLSLFIGVLDGFGLSMFLPLLQMINDSSTVDSETMGNLGFLIDFFESVNIPLTLLSILGLMTVFFIGKGIAQYFSLVYNVNIREWFIKKIRIQNIRGLNTLAYKYFVMSDVGRIQNTMTGEVNRVAASFFNYFKALEYGVLVFVYMAFAFTIDPQFALLVSIGGILSNFLYNKLYRNTKGVSRTLTGENNVFQSLIIQNVANYKYLKATGSLDRYGDKLVNSVEKIKDSNTKIGMLDALLTAGREPILIIVVVAVIYIQTTLLGSELGPILMSLLFFYRALNYLMQMQVRYNKFLAVSGSLENMSLFGEELRKNKEKKGEIKVEDEIKDLNLTGINFNYGETSILVDISLQINRKETVAFVGESGSGKTTLVNIIAGLLPFEQGTYKINEHEISDIDKTSLQDKIGYITQDPVIFNDTVYNNITFWDDETEENKNRFWEAVRQSAIFDFIDDLPHKEQTILENNGVNLSGGQRQRISIARELYKKVEILIMDEATSALDSETEKAIQNNIENLKGKYTILIVAHRISTIKNADRIVVMKNGKISNVGSFSELIRESKYFEKLVELQEV